VAAGQPLCLIGDPGTGKSHLLIGLGTAAENGYRVRYVTAAALVNELVEAADDKTLSRVISCYGRSTFCAWTSSATSSWTAAAPSFCSRFSPSGRKEPPTPRMPCTGRTWPRGRGARAWRSAPSPRSCPERRCSAR